MIHYFNDKICNFRHHQKLYYWVELYRVPGSVINKFLPVVHFRFVGERTKSYPRQASLIQTRMFLLRYFFQKMSLTFSVICTVVHVACKKDIKVKPTIRARPNAMIQTSWHGKSQQVKYSLIINCMSLTA